MINEKKQLIRKKCLECKKWSVILPNSKNINLSLRICGFCKKYGKDYSIKHYNEIKEKK